MMWLRAYARRRGCTLRAVQKAIEEERIRKERQGRIDPAQADADWTANTDPSQTGGDEPELGFQAARTKQLLIRIDRDESELEQARERPIGLEVAQRLTFTAFRTMRAARWRAAVPRLLRLPAGAEVG